jgi:hypothetical protein
MKKISILLILAFGFGINLNAQLALSNFNSAGLNGWQMINDANTPSAAVWNATFIARWQASAFVKVPIATGDSALLACAVFTPAGPPDRWLISPSFTVNSANQFFLFDHYGSLSGQTLNEEFEILVSPTAGTTKASFTASVATITNSSISKTLSANIGAYNGQTIRVAIRYKSPNGYLAFLDNFRTNDLPNVDGRMVSVSPAPNAFSAFTSVGSTINISGVVQNLGANAVTSYDVFYQVDNNTPVTMNQTPFFFPAYDIAVVNFTVPYTVATAGKKNIKVWISIPGDTSRANDTIKTSVTGVTTMINKTPLLEVFTSSTCGPCTPGNEHLHSIIDSKDSNSYNVVKYQQDFPGTGDPYATVETVNRRGWYAINSIPRMEINGGWDGNASSFTETLFTNATQEKSFISLSGTYKLDTVAKTVAIAMDIKPLADLSANEFKVIYALVERVTVKNKKTNGETMFTQVVKKLIPNENGTLIEAISPTLLTGNTTFKHNTTFTLPGAYRLPANGTTANQIKLATENSVENFNNLYVVAWVEGRTQRVVLQSARLAKFSSAGGGTLAVSDSAFKSVDSNASLTVSNTEVSINKKLTAGKEYSWMITNTSLPSYWSMLSVCDKFDCYFAPIVGPKKFTAVADSTKNFIKVDIQHNKKTGYGYVVLAVYDRLDSAATVKTTKFSLLVKKGTGGTGSVSRVEDAKDFYFSDNKLYFTGSLLPVRYNILTLDGRQIRSNKVTNSTEIIEDILPSGIYLIEAEYKDKTSQVLKVNF